MAGPRRGGRARKTVGQFVMVNALLLQLFIPLNFMGMVYREIRQSLTDIERMMDVLAEAPEVADRPGAVPLAVAGGTIRFENVRFCYEPERIDPGRPLLRGAGRQDGGDRRARRAPASRRSRASCCASTTWPAAA